MTDKKKAYFSKSPILEKVSRKFHWVSRIDWREGHWWGLTYMGHWCGLTYMALRLSDISSKRGKKCIFSVFRPFLSLCRTASQLFRLPQQCPSHQLILLTQGPIHEFLAKNFWELVILKNISFFLFAILNFFASFTY